MSYESCTVGSMLSDDFLQPLYIVQVQTETGWAPVSDGETSGPVRPAVYFSEGAADERRDAMAEQFPDQTYEVAVIEPVQVPPAEPVVVNVVILG